VDVSALDAIDVHTHVHRSVTAAPETSETLEAMAAYFKTAPAAYTVDELWQEEALAVATHKPQVYIDLSGWSPKYFPPILVQYANTLLKDKVLFGTDFPMLTPERWRADLERTAIRDEVKPGLYKDNAARLLRL
jgi:predicted TIM-barrel fold metal-dependent hydrolase